MRFGFTALVASLTVGMLGAMGGCKKSGDASIAQMTELKTKMCACKDKGCIDQVTAEMAKWSADHRSGGTDNASDDHKKLAAIAGEMTACMTQVMRDSAPAAPAAGSAAQPGSGATGSGADGTAAAGGS